MRKYLELIDNVSEVSKIKSYRVPYVGATNNGQVLFSPQTPEGVEFINYVGTLEWIIDSPSVLSFAIPNYSKGHCLFVPDDDNGSSPITFGNSWSEILLDGKKCFELANMPHELYLNGSSDIKIVDIQFNCSGTLTIEIMCDIYELLDNSIVVHKEIPYVINGADRLLLLKSDLIRHGSSFFTWTGETTATLYFFDNIYSDDPIEVSTSSVELLPNTPTQLYESVLKFVYFVENAKLVSDSSGTLIVTSFALPPQNGALLLDYSTEFTANKDTVFAFPSTWNEKPVMFVPSIVDGVKMEISNSPLFDTENNTVLTLSISTYKESAIHLTKSNLNSILTIAKDEYVYIRFVSDYDTIIFTVQEWDVPECVEGVMAIKANTTFSISSSSASSRYYRLRYEDFSGYDMSVNWEGTARVTMYIGDTCKFASNTSNEHVVHSKAINKKTTYVIPAATVDSWASRVSPDGFLYVKFSSTSGKITFQTEKPETEMIDALSISDCGCEAE